AVLVMTRYFEPHLVVADPAKAIGVGRVRNRHGGEKMVVEPGAADSGKRQEALFREQRVQFKLADFDIQPWRVQQIVEANPGVFEMECVSFAHRRQHGERYVLVEGAGGPDVEAGKVEPVRGHSLFGPWCDATWIVDLNLGLALKMPLGRDAEGDRPIRRIL